MSSDSAPSVIEINRDGEIAILRLNRPDRLNAFTAQMGQEIIDAFDEFDSDDAVRAVVITGNGRAFCAGADLGGGADTFDASGVTSAGSFSMSSPRTKYSTSHWRSLAN